MEKAYRQIKRDYAADKGDELYAKGKNVASMKMKSTLGTGLYIYGAMRANEAVRKTGWLRIGSLEIDQRAVQSLTLGSSAIATALNLKASSDMNKMGASHFYRRSIT